MQRDAIQQYQEQAALKIGRYFEYLEGDARVVHVVTHFWARILAVPFDTEYRKPIPVVECEPPKN